MMFSSDKKVAENLGGIILHHETLYQTDKDGKRIVDHLTEKGILKVLLYIDSDLTYVSIGNEN